jgi:hypothetical protein
MQKFDGFDDIRNLIHRTKVVAKFWQDPFKKSKSEIIEMLVTSMSTQWGPFRLDDDENNKLKEEIERAYDELEAELSDIARAAELEPDAMGMLYYQAIDEISDMARKSKFCKELTHKIALDKDEQRKESLIRVERRKKFIEERKRLKQTG